MKKLFLILLFCSICPTGLYGEEFPHIKGWAEKGDLITYKPANLWEYIDGAANLYLSYDFRLLKLKEFHKDDIILTVEIYDMGSPINAFGIYSSECPDDTGLLKIGTEAAVILPYHALMLKDRFYVKVVIQQGELDQEKGENILRDAAVFLPGNTDFPPELKLLPEKDRISGSVKYVTEGYLGLSEISNLLYADYKDANGKEFRHFILLPGGNNDVKKILDRLSAKWKTHTQEGRTILYREVPYEGFIGVILSSNMIAGVSGVADKDELFGLLHMD